MPRSSEAQQHEPDAPTAPPVPTRTVRLRTVLVALLVAAVAPALGMAAFALWQSADAQRQASASRLADTARALAHTLEGELKTKASLLQAMASGIGSGGIGLAQAQAWLDGLRTGQARFVLSYEDGAGPSAAPALPPQLVRDGLRHGGVSLSDLFIPAAGEAPAVALSVPLPLQEGQAALLSLVQPATQLLSLAPQRTRTEEALLVAVTDGQGRLVARSRDGNRLVGQQMPDWNRLKAANMRSGQIDATTAEGGRVVLSYETLAATPGWVVAVAEPRTLFDQTWQRPLLQLAAAGAIGTLVALLAAAWLSRTIVRPVHDLARNAEAVAAAPDGQVPSLALARPSAITEFESMRHSIEAAQAALHARAETERRNSAALALNALRYRTLARTGAVVLWRGTPDGRLTAVDGWSLLTGEPDEAALGHGWQRRMHPEDQVALQPPAGTHMDLEFRVARADGSWCWVRGRGAAVPSDDGVVREWVGVLEDVSERHRAQARVAHMALHDALTDLPNRVEFRNRLNAAIRRAGRGEAGAVLYIDLDRFKAVNDTLGHPAGDALLLAVTARLRALLRQDDTVARLAGDEFAIIQSPLGSPAAAAGLAERVVRSLSAPYDIAGHRVLIGASVGIMPIQDGRHSADQLLKYADLALYRAKQEGRGRYAFFEPGMDARMQARRQAELELRDALERGEFALAYAPLVDAARRLCGVAALLHWNHPRRGHLPAAEFMPLADELGLSGRLVEWALARTCHELAAWPDCPKAALDISPALRWGVPMAQRWIEQALGSAALAPPRLELEITECALMAYPETAGRLLQLLRARGVRTALTGFGAARSALGLLLQLPVDRLQLDPALLQGGPAGVQAMALLCAQRGIVLGAEGVDGDALAALAGPHMPVELQDHPCAAEAVPPAGHGLLPAAA
ncbi:diguanylate cyclase domain-containing protein [Pseudorhodoferax sp.]|uniref:bifunctional diguanylate cyclase/phosphodiesterase n=1 Tax=Pseudorhodoferax sp. TaxID=1993553 RepID=UPI0039E64F31